MPHQGVASSFNFGKSAGFIEGVLCALGIPYQLITPQRWKKEFTLNSDKQKSIDVCERLFPNVDLLPTPRCKVKSDGMAEALLMAEYARRNL
jgi:crossover junction endodeoxyribonuclease RuvC